MHKVQQACLSHALHCTQAAVWVAVLFFFWALKMRNRAARQATRILDDACTPMHLCAHRQHAAMPKETRQRACIEGGEIERKLHKRPDESRIGLDSEPDPRLKPLRCMHEQDRLGERRRWTVQLRGQLGCEKKAARGCRATENGKLALHSAAAVDY